MQSHDSAANAKCQEVWGTIIRGDGRRETRLLAYHHTNPVKRWVTYAMHPRAHPTYIQLYNEYLLQPGEFDRKKRKAMKVAGASLIVTVGALAAIHHIKKRG
jgi:hypothetical protein